MSLRELVEREELLQVLGAYDAITAKMAEQAGAEAVYMSGSVVSTSVTGGPDVGVTTMTEMATRAHQMSGTISVPLVADGDTGYGNELNVRRTVEEYERAGVNAIQMEDQTFPKRCGHFEGKSIVEPAEFATKVEAAVDARKSDDFLVIARTDALAVNGIEDAIRRANLYREAGADIMFVEAPTTREQMERIIEEVPGLHLANMASFGKTPALPADELEEIGYSLAIYPADAFKAGLRVFREVYESIISTGGQSEILGLQLGWEERDEITGLSAVDALETAYERKRQVYEEQF